MSGWTLNPMYLGQNPWATLPEELPLSESQKALLGLAKAPQGNGWMTEAERNKGLVGPGKENMMLASMDPATAATSAASGAEAMPPTPPTLPPQANAAGGPPAPKSTAPGGADYLALLGQLRDKGNTIAGEQRDNAKSMQPYMDQMLEPNLHADLSPLLALTDSWTGSNLQKGYKSPESGKERMNNVMGLKKNINDMGIEASGTELNALKQLASGTFDLDKFKADQDYKKQTLDIQREQNRILAAKAAAGSDKPSAGLKKLDEKFAEDYKEDVLKGGLSSAGNQVKGLKTLLSSAQAAGTKISGPDTISEGIGGAIYSPEAVQFRQAVEQAVQGSLKATLGAQFTEKEGKGIMARTYDPNLPPAENLRRLNVLVGNLEQAAKAKRAAYDHYQKNGYSMAGYNGMADFEGDFLNKLQFGGSNTPTRSPKDEAAIAYAQAHPEDPDAAAVLQLHGVTVGAK